MYTKVLAQRSGAGVEPTQRRASVKPKRQSSVRSRVWIETIGAALNLSITTAPEAAVASVGRPDVAVLVDGLLTGYVEAKAPGLAVRASQLRGRDREQWQRFSLLPNLVYTNGQSWFLYRHGEQVLEAQLPQDPAAVGENAVDASSARDLRRVLESFLRWEPIVPSSPKELAVTLAPLCRFLASEVHEALETRPAGAIASLWSEWRQLLFHDAGEDQFADAYAQTVTFSLLLARVEGGEVSSLDDAVGSLRSEHGLLAEVLRWLATSPAGSCRGWQSVPAAEQVQTVEDEIGRVLAPHVEATLVRPAQNALSRMGLNVREPA